MGLRINQNIAAQNAYRSLSVSDNQMSKSLEKLSSGFRINRAADDAAGLAISEGLRSQVGGLKVAVRNAQDGVSVVQTAEGALNEVHSVLQRMRDLAVQAGNDSNNDEARANIATEVSSLRDELSRIGNSTNFNGTKLLDGSASALTFQVGADGDANSRIAVDLSSANVTDIASKLGGDAATFDIITPTAVDGAMTFGVAGDATNDVTVTLGAAGTYKTVGDVAEALNQNTAFAEKFSASVNKDNQLVVSSKIGTNADVQGGTGAGAGMAVGTGVSTAASNTNGLSFASAATAQAAIDTIDAQIGTVSTARAKLGAYQNRFEHTINNANVAVENLSASESRIRDTDMAQEMMSFTRSQILTQAGTSMLSQANQSAQNVLSLLR
ncbi:flagellin N-terminal helical domain-containing protein [Jidongwangia harbinensis]|uniref:flagellin N-terminal helical domain-containing protein n=1 Tax=Jidongwangia harbinensis TaxID=2878561 RepID=UPI001CDA0D6B|nr:flagellin [Jidongwangia harbinensis]MCA2213722.1 flagellin [Jidongwangia harbinensis]